MELPGVALEPHGITSSAAIAAPAALAVPGRLGGRCSVLAGDVVQELGQLAEGDMRWRPASVVERFAEWDRGGSNEFGTGGGAKGDRTPDL